MDDNEPRGEVSPQVIQALTKYLGGEENDSGPVYLDKTATYSTLEYVREVCYFHIPSSECVLKGLMAALSP